MIRLAISQQFTLHECGRQTDKQTNEPTFCHCVTRLGLSFTLPSTCTKGRLLWKKVMETQGVEEVTW